MVISMMHDVLLSLIAVAFLPLIIYSAAQGEYIANTGFSNRDLKTTSDIAESAISNIQTVQAYNMQDCFYSQYMDSSLCENSAVMRTSVLSGLQFGLRYLSIYCLWATLLWYGAYRVHDHDLSMEDMVIVLFCTLLPICGFCSLSGLSTDLHTCLTSARRLFKILDYKSELTSSSEGYSGPVEGLVEFKEVDFQDEGRHRHRHRHALHCLSFRLGAGTCSVLTGPQREEKSAIFQLMLRFCEPAAGEICLDEMPLRHYSMRYLRNTVCWVGKEPILFRGSVLYNLKIAAGELSTDSAIEALGKVEAMEILQKFGIDSDVGVRGCKLSAGYRQKIAIARAIVRRPKVLLLDELERHLDPQTEDLIMENVRREGFTVIAISHRMSAVRKFAHIMCMQQGTVVESGTHDELMEIENGSYRNLFEKSL